MMYKQVAFIMAGFILCMVVNFATKELFVSKPKEQFAPKEPQVHFNPLKDGVTETKVKPHPNKTPPGDWKTWYSQLSIVDKENEFYRYLRELHTNCKGMVRLGRIADGGWEVCLEAGYKPQPGCLVYSFGINNLWDFDDGAAQLGCEVHSFDPSMKRDDFKRGERISFHNLGLDGINGTDKRGWGMKTLGATRKMLGHTDKTIDILKMDIEFSEWAAFAEAFKENSLKNVKQLMFEVHTSMTIAMKKPVDDQAYIGMYGVFKTLENMGFLLYWSTTNIQDRHVSPVTGKTRFCCFETYWINKNYRKS